MVIEFPYLRQYLFTALESAPALFDHLIVGLTDDEADRRPDPARFTIREAMAHLADWEPVFLSRMRRICEEDEPLLEGYDEGQWAVDHNYASTDVFEQSRLFGERRAHMVEFLRSRNPADWQRIGDRPEIGRITLETLTLLIPLHDTYHLRQIAAWRQAG
jgi:hypothetical protein